jgi:hypothetical protein
MYSVGYLEVLVVLELHDLWFFECVFKE